MNIICHLACKLSCRSGENRNLCKFFSLCIANKKFEKGDAFFIPVFIVEPTEFISFEWSRGRDRGGKRDFPDGNPWRPGERVDSFRDPVTRQKRGNTIGLVFNCDAVETENAHEFRRDNPKCLIFRRAESCGVKRSRTTRVQRSRRVKREDFRGNPTGKNSRVPGMARFSCECRIFGYEATKMLFRAVGVCFVFRRLLLTRKRVEDERRVKKKKTNDNKRKNETK